MSNGDGSKFTRIVSLADISHPKQWPTLSKQQMSASGYPVYGANGKIGYNTTFTHEKPTLLIGCRGTCGSVHITEPYSYANGNAMALDHLDTSIASLRYIFNFLRFDGLKSVTTGASQPQITRQNLVRLEIPLPPLDEQRRIAAVLDKADALRRQRQESLQLTEKLLQAVFLDMFGDPAQQPQSRLADLLNRPLRNGLSPASGGTHTGTVFTLSAITRGFFNSKARKEAMFSAPPKPAAYVDAADFLICRGNGNLNLCGQGQFPTDDAVGIIFPDTIIAASIDLTRVSKAYFATLWNQPYIRQQLEGGARTAAGIHKVNQTTLSNIRIPVPEFERQIEFERIAQLITSRRPDLEASAEFTEALFSSLQQRAFRGELDLSRLVLDPQENFHATPKPEKQAIKINKRKTVSFSLRVPPAVEATLKELDRRLNKGEPIPWSADYFKYRILAAQSAPFNFDEVMQKAASIFEEVIYEQIRDIMFELVGQNEAPSLLRQHFDVDRKEIVFHPAL